MTRTPTGCLVPRTSISRSSKADTSTPESCAAASEMTMAALNSLAADSNRLAMSKTPAYRWLTLNAGRYGFLNYAFEPWHWEWAGETPP